MTRPGLTLVEVLAATVLLCGLAVVAVGFTRDAARVTSQTNQDDAIVFELGIIANRMMADREMYLRLGGRGRFTPVTVSMAAGEGVLVSRVEPDTHGDEHAWIIFESRGHAVSRWVALTGDRREEAP